MKIALWIIGIIVGLSIALYGLQYAASERVEVVDLHTTDETGSTVITRLWVVDHEGLQYLRSGDGASGWYQRILANDTIKLTRNGVTLAYAHESRLDLAPKINELMREKYTWGDRLVELMLGGRDRAVAIELKPG
jgi:hypothetical protein